MNRGSPPFPQTEISRIISEWCVFSLQKCSYGGREWDRRNGEEFSSSREQKLRSKRASAEL